MNFTNNELAIVAWGTKDSGKEIFFKTNIADKDYQVNNIFGDIMTPVQFKTIKNTFFSFENHENFASFSIYKTIRDGFGRGGY